MILHQLKLDAFRGATKDVTVDFDPNKKITLIFGENGTGKSTIVDGLSFICDKSLGSLEDRSGAQEDKYLVAVGRQKKELCVRLTCAGGTWAAAYSGSKIKVSPEFGCPKLKVLRRAALIKFTEAKPSERYEKIKSFIETPCIEKSEQTLRGTISAISVEQDALSQAYSEAKSQLEKLWVKEHTNDDEDAITWARRIATQDEAIREAEIASINEFKTLIDRFQESKCTIQPIIQAESIAQGEYDQAAAQQVQEESKLVDHSIVLLDLLRAADIYVGQHLDATKCPLCDNLTDSNLLHTTLSARITALETLSAAVDAAKEKHSALLQKQKNVREALKTISSQVNNITSFLSQKKLPLQCQFTIDNEITVKLHDESLASQKRLQAVIDIDTVLTAHFAGIKLYLDEIKKTVALKNAISIQLDGIDGNSNRKGDLQTLYQRLNTVLTIIENERKCFVNDVLTEVSQNISDLYEKIHPNEKLSDIKLLLDQKYQGSLHIKGVFCQKTDIPPQAYFSESHLDTLGICIWLALTKKYAGKDTIVILDDILTSVDSAHLDRFIDMLDGEAENYGHVLLTTHYRPWRERYSTHQSPSVNEVKFIELKEWHPDWGIITNSYKPAIDELQDHLQPHKFERRIVASKAGIFLESILDHFALRYSLMVPRKPSNNYTLGELLHSLNKKKRELLRVEHLDDSGQVTETIPLKPIIDAIDAYTWVRNQVGCHFNISGQETSDKDVREFATKVVELGQAIICPNGGDIPEKNKSGSYFESKSGHCRLYPLKMP